MRVSLARGWALLIRLQAELHAGLWTVWLRISYRPTKPDFDLEKYICTSFTSKHYDRILYDIVMRPKSHIILTAALNKLHTCITITVELLNLCNERKKSVHFVTLDWVLFNTLPVLSSGTAAPLLEYKFVLRWSSFTTARIFVPMSSIVQLSKTTFYRWHILYSSGQSIGVSYFILRLCNSEPPLIKDNLVLYYVEGQLY